MIKKKKIEIKVGKQKKKNLEKKNSAKHQKF